MPFSGGTRTVGSVGGFYATWEAALADLDVILTGNTTLQQVSPTTELNTAKPPSGFDWNGWILTLTTDSYRHAGLGQNDGRLIDFTHNDNGFDFTDIDGGTDPGIIMEHLYMRRTGFPLSGIHDVLLSPDTGSWGFAQRTFRYLLMDGNGGAGQNGLTIADSVPFNVASFDIHHCIIFDYDGTSLRAHMNSSARIEHVTCTANGVSATTHFQFSISTGGEVKNCFGSGSFGNAYQNHGSVNGQNNSSGDASADDGNWNVGSGNLTGITNFEFISFILTNLGFLRPNFNATIVGAGTNTVTIFPSRDMMDQEYPRTKSFTTQASQSIYTIGAHQPSVMATDDIETDDQLTLTGGTFRLTGLDTLQGTEDDALIKAFPMTASDQLGLSEVANVVSAMNVNGEDTISILDATTDSPEFVCIPDTVVNRRRINMWFPVDTLANILTLPQPIFGDTYRLDTRIRTRHSKGGDLRVYKRGKVLHALNMSFSVERPVRDLCLAFFELSSSDLIRLYDWEGRLWNGVIINTPISFTSEGKASDTEKFGFDLEFEGLRVD